MSKTKQVRELLHQLKQLNKQMRQDILNIDRDIARLDVAFVKDQIREEMLFLKIITNKTNKQNI